MTTDIAAPHWTTYHVSGATLADVATALSGRPEAGSTSWHPSWSYEQENGVVTAVTIQCGFDVVMPDWTGYANASAEAQAEWDRWYGALEEHEYGHLKIAEAAFVDLEPTLVGQTVAAATAGFNAAVTKAQTDSDAYDANNGHGTTAANSTVMDTSIP